MQKKIDLYVNEKDQPQHLAVLNERPNTKGDGQYRPLCGADILKLTVDEFSPREVDMPCKICKEQFEIWREVHADEV